MVFQGLTFRARVCSYMPWGCPDKRPFEMIYLPTLFICFGGILYFLSFCYGFFQPVTVSVKHILPLMLFDRAKCVVN
jgi:hypothetical protein